MNSLHSLYVLVVFQKKIEYKAYTYVKRLVPMMASSSSTSLPLLEHLSSCSCTRLS